MTGRLNDRHSRSTQGRRYGHAHAEADRRHSATSEGATGNELCEQSRKTKQCGLDRSYFGGVERGERNLSFFILCQICAGLNCDIASVTKGIPHPEPLRSRPNTRNTLPH
jgi:hypothetical protein